MLLVTRGMRIKPPRDGIHADQPDLNQKNGREQVQGPGQRVGGNGRLRDPRGRASHGRGVNWDPGRVGAQRHLASGFLLFPEKARNNILM